MKKFTQYAAFLVLIVIGWETASYFINQHDHAVVYTKSCLNENKSSCLKYEGKLKRGFFSGDYIIANSDKEIHIAKNDVAVVQW